ncbi:MULTISPECIES: YtcA family lipoprotein [unclassified Cupriavidus]|uniref:YtcA family lipoprotein n=1 Tax=unclassified Cupriavidus TaxID=2640874 RepID=UPI001FB82CA3|nr:MULTISPECIES: YtcA family lipoprotein [unclassified Cupriavidus]
MKTHLIPKESRNAPHARQCSATLTLVGVSLVCAMLGGCATAPSIGVLGAYFPDWLFCIVGAIAGTAVLHAILRATGRVLPSGTPFLPLAYGALTVVLALTGWLIFFQN